MVSHANVIKLEIESENLIMDSCCAGFTTTLVEFKAPNKFILLVVIVLFYPILTHSPFLLTHTHSSAKNAGNLLYENV